MKLSHVLIKNFRSIAEARIEFVPQCRALIGINECGKTNILDALSLLSNDISPTSNDIREPLDGEQPIRDAYVRFVFRLSAEDKAIIDKTIRKKAVIGSGTQPLFVDSSVTLGDFIDSIKEGLYTVDLLTQMKSARYWTLPERQLADGWLKPKPGLDPTIVVKSDESMIAPLSSFAILSPAAIPKEKFANCEPLTFKDLASIIGAAITTLVTESLPECFIWSYSDSQLLPPSVPRSSFAALPSSYEPLRQMFRLAGYNDVARALSDAEAKSNGLRNLLRRVSSSATRHMCSVWKDYKGIEINVEPNGDNIEINVKDSHNLFDFSRRSDGFKRFISFLFLVSARTATGSLRNVLYLHDEPDTGLHPSGARHLLSELIKVAKDNYVVFSTHSIFMIDRKRIDRHYIVTKNKEVTTIKAANTSNFTDEEVLFNALEFSAFQLLKERNILFEGWRDKRLFEVAITGKSETARSLASVAKSLGYCHAQGVKDISKISSLVEMGRRNWIVISDGDKPAMDHQKAYSWSERWHRYDELVPDLVIITAEDFFDATKIRSVLAKVVKRHSIDVPKNLTIPHVGVLKLIQQELQRAGVPEGDVRAILSDFKDELIDGARPTDLRSAYFQVMVNAIEKLNDCDENSDASS